MSILCLHLWNLSFICLRVAFLFANYLFAKDCHVYYPLFSHGMRLTPEDINIQQNTIKT